METKPVPSTAPIPPSAAGHTGQRGAGPGACRVHTELCVTLLSWHRRDNLHSRFTSSPQASLVLPHGPSWATTPPAPLHTPAHTTHHTPSKGWTKGSLPCSWAQHPPNTPTASNQSVSLLPSWYCSCHTPSLSPGVWNNQQCRAMAPHNFEEHGDLRGKS